MNSNEILTLAQEGKLPWEISKLLMITDEHVYRWTPASWYADPMADEEALSKPPLSLEVNYYIQQQRDAGANGYCQEEQRLTRNLKKCWLKSFKKYHGTEMDLF